MGCTTSLTGGIPSATDVVRESNSSRRDGSTTVPGHDCRGLASVVYLCLCMEHYAGVTCGRLIFRRSCATGGFAVNLSVMESVITDIEHGEMISQYCICMVDDMAMKWNTWVRQVRTILNGNTGISFVLCLAQCFISFHNSTRRNYTH